MFEIGSQEMESLQVKGSALVIMDNAVYRPASERSGLLSSIVPQT
jgi:hypothetical protein